MNEVVQEIFDAWEYDADPKDLTREEKWDIVITRLKELQCQILAPTTGVEFKTMKELLQDV